MISIRPQPDGTYPHDGGRWFRFNTLEDQGEAERFLEKKLGFRISLDHWLNKSFLSYEVGVGSASAIYLHDHAWYLIRTIKPEVIQEIKAKRQETLRMFQGALTSHQKELVVNHRNLGAYGLKNLTEEVLNYEAQVDLAQKLLARCS